MAVTAACIASMLEALQKIDHRETELEGWQKLCLACAPEWRAGSCAAAVWLVPLSCSPDTADVLRQHLPQCAAAGAAPQLHQAVCCVHNSQEGLLDHRAGHRWGAVGQVSHAGDQIESVLLPAVLCCAVLVAAAPMVTLLYA